MKIYTTLVLIFTGSTKPVKSHPVQSSTYAPVYHDIPALPLRGVCIRGQVRIHQFRSGHGPFLVGFGLEGSELDVGGATILTAEEEGLEKKAMVVDRRQRVRGRRRWRSSQHVR